MLIGTGGFAGTVSRYLLTRFINNNFPITFPLGTYAVNIFGCLLIGIIMGLSFQSSVNTQTRLMLATGFCGGFTTFSTYSLEIFELYQRGEAAVSFAYLGGSIITGLLSIGVGLWLGKTMASS